MSNPKDGVAVVTDAMYVILGGTGNTGSIIANFLLSKGQKVRVDVFAPAITERLSPLRPAPGRHRLRLFVDQNFGKQLLKIADTGI